MIDILMATYNGGHYIENQILSIIGQTHEDWRLLIHDDGSTDNTIQIIKKYIQIDTRIQLIEDGKKCGGPGRNFMHLLNSSNAEYIAFCDQDDIWLESKLELQMLEMKKFSGPTLIYSNGYTYSKGEIVPQKFVTFHRTTLEDSLFLNGGIHGCCLLFNRELLSTIDFSYPDYVYMHDHFITILAVSLGQIRYLDAALILYRQHENNATGNIDSSLKNKIITFLNRNNTILESRHYNANKSFFTKYRHLLNDKEIKLFEEYIKYPNVSISSRVSIVLKNAFKVKSTLILLIKTIWRKAL